MKKRVSNLQIFASFLFTLVLFHGQAMALVGGPAYPVTESAGGLYSGVMVQIYSTLDGKSDSNDFDITSLNTSSGSIALFSVEQPPLGLGTGEIVVFDEGRVFTGLISTAISPKGGDIKGIITAGYTYSLFVGYNNQGNATFVDLSISMNGTFYLNVASNNMFNSDLLAIEGEAELLRNNGDIDQNGNLVIDDKVIYAIDGYKY